jgi:hypothetical protein
MRFTSTAFVICLVAAAQNPAGGLVFNAADGAYAILHFQIADAAVTLPAAALEVVLDGRSEQVVVLTPGAKRPRYEALLGPLTAGSHDVRLKPSPLWPWDNAMAIDRVGIDVVAPADARFESLANAPAIGLRPDTVGTASDLPLLMYVEDVNEGGAHFLKYSIIFSHEDGGTPGPALMARWGRTTDIELAYEVEVRDGRVVQARYQGPDHQVIHNQRLDIHPPFLLVSTLNNMFLDRGRSLATVRMQPLPIDLSRRSRESVMDDHPWIYRVMARELATERPAGVGDPRDYLYVDLRLTSRAAGIALGVRTTDGTTRWSDRGRADLVVSRQGEMRLAVPTAAGERLTALTVRCDPRPEPNQSAEPAHCDAELRKAFRLDDDRQPRETLIAPARLTIQAGTARDIPFAADKIKR